MRLTAMHPRGWWAVMWRSENRLDGRRRWFIGAIDISQPYYLFRTRKEAQAWIEKRYGYIRERKDLRREPHGWRMPIPVRVQVEIREMVKGR